MREKVYDEAIMSHYKFNFNPLTAAFSFILFYDLNHFSQ